jgi:hypothetical protein
MCSFRRLLRCVIPLVALLLVSCRQQVAPPTPEASLASFQISVRRTDTGVSLTCSRGCAWTELSIGGMEDVSVPINQFGMAEH